MPPKKKARGLCEGKKTLFNLWITLDNHSKEQEGPTETPTETEVRKEARKFQSNWLTIFSHPSKNRLNTDSQDHLMRIKINGVTYDNFEFNSIRALEVQIKTKNL